MLKSLGATMAQVTQRIRQASWGGTTERKRLRTVPLVGDD